MLIIGFPPFGCFLQVFECNVATQNARNRRFLQKSHFYALIIIQTLQFVNGFFAKKSQLEKLFNSGYHQSYRSNSSPKRLAVSEVGGERGKRYSAWQSPIPAITYLTGMGLVSQKSACISGSACL